MQQVIPFLCLFLIWNFHKCSYLVSKSTSQEVAIYQHEMTHKALKTKLAVTKAQQFESALKIVIASVYTLLYIFFKLTFKLEANYFIIL